MSTMDRAWGQSDSLELGDACADADQGPQRETERRHTIIEEDDGIFLSSSLSYFQKINPLVLGFVIRSSKTSGLNFQEYSNYLLYVGVVTNKCLIFV